MRVTVEIPDNLIDDLLKVTGERTKTRAICLAIKDYILQKRKEKLLSLSGKIHFDLDWKEMEEIELKATRKRLGSEETVEKAIRRSRALAALRKMQKKSMKSKLNRLTDSQIRSEIRAVRKARRQ
jgi:Arc/MetJ family transcription regulator